MFLRVPESYNHWSFVQWGLGSVYGFLTHYHLQSKYNIISNYLKEQVSSVSSGNSKFVFELQTSSDKYGGKEGKKASVNLWNIY